MGKLLNEVPPEEGLRYRRKWVVMLIADFIELSDIPSETIARVVVELDFNSIFEMSHIGYSIANEGGFV